MNTGILIIALQHRYYMDLAVNLAASIKVNDGVPIHLAHDGAYDVLPDDKKRLFASASVVRAQPFKAKTLMYDLSPFEATLYLDADTIILPSVDIKGFFKKQKGKQFDIINMPFKKNEANTWAEVSSIRKVTGNNNDAMPNYYSEAVYFEKNPIMERYFKAVKEAYDDPGLEYRGIAKQVPDELAFTIAALKEKVYPCTDSWCPLFWHFRNRKDTSLPTYELAKKYIGYSVGGNELPTYVRSCYNNLLSYYSKKSGILLKQIEEKRIVLRERIKL